MLIGKHIAFSKRICGFDPRRVHTHLDMYYQDKAIVLARQNFREDDLLVACYTQKHGKVMLHSKGAKKIKSKLAGHIEPMNLVEINWVAGKGGDKLIGASTIESFKLIKDDYHKVNYGFYFLEIINKATRVHHADKILFEFINGVLNKLQNADEKDLSIIKLCFDYKILFLLGHAPVYRKELNSEQKDIVKKIINLPVDEIIKLNLTGQFLKNLYNKSKEFLEEVVEEEIQSINFMEE